MKHYTFNTYLWEINITTYQNEDWETCKLEANLNWQTKTYKIQYDYERAAKVLKAMIKSNDIDAILEDKQDVWLWRCLAINLFQQC